MRQAVPQVLQSLDAKQPVAYCRLVETRGSTPQKAGAVMLVYGDGSQHGTLGGGCVEAEVKRRALAVLGSGTAGVAEFQLDHDYGWDDGLICGGRMTVAMFALVDETYRDYFDSLQQALEAGQGIVESIVYGSSKAPNESAESIDANQFAPQSYLFNEQAECLASIGAGRSEAHASQLDLLQQDMPALKDRPRPVAKSGVAYLPMMCRHRLMIVGAGHIGQAVARLATDLDFDVTVIDDRADCATHDRFPEAVKLMVGPMPEVLPSLDVTATTYCLIVTRGHNHDQEALFHLAKKPACYIGLIGSRRKIKLIFDNLVSEGIPAESLRRVFAPIGIEIGSQTVPEIAVSVAAELVAHRNLGVVPGRPNSIPVGGGEPNN